MAGTNFFVPISATCDVAFVGTAINTTTGLQLAMFAKCTSTPPTTANVFDHGCLLIQTDGTTGTSSVFENTGSAATPVWALVSSGQTNGIVYGAVAKPTSGTVVQNIFGATVPFAATITSAYTISADNAVANITILGTSGTVATIAKGSTGAMVGATTVANASIAKGDTLTVVSNSATGNAVAVLTFTNP